MKTILWVLILSGCASTTAHWRVRCTKYDTQSRLVYWPAPRGSGFSVTPFGAGTNVGGGIHLVTTRKCIKRDSTWIVPQATR